MQKSTSGDAGIAPVENLGVHDATALFELMTLMQLAYFEPQAIQTLRRRFEQVTTAVDLIYLPALRTLCSEIEALSDQPHHSPGDKTAQDELTFARLPLMLPLPPPEIDGRREVAHAIRDVIVAAAESTLRRCHASPLYQMQQRCAHHCSHGVLVFDAAGHCTFRNPAADRLLDNTKGRRHGLPTAITQLVQRMMKRDAETLDPCTFKVGERLIRACPLIANRDDGSTSLQILLYSDDTETAIATRLTGHAELSMQEATVLRHMLSGRTYRKIAEEMELSTHTVRTYAERIFEKLNVRNRHEMMRVAATLRGRYGSSED